MTQRQLIKALTQQLADMRAELTTLEATGKSNDLKAIFLREGIPATEYRIEVETDELTAPKHDMRFNARGGRPLRKVQR